PSEALQPYLVPELIAESGFRLARFTREDCLQLGPEELLEKVDECRKERVFTILEGVFDPVRQPLMDWLRNRPHQRCRLSGKENRGVTSTTLGGFAEAMQVYTYGVEMVTGGGRGGKKGLPGGCGDVVRDSPGTFFLDKNHEQKQV
ncbi:unnamed protein product, partial [Choristocarpus tenellus]